MTGIILFGTRPEAIKLAPVIREFCRRTDRSAFRVISSGQHRTLLSQNLTSLNIEVDANLNVMMEAQNPSETVNRITTALQHEFTDKRPDWIMVQGDTATVFAGAMAGYLNQIPVIHLEAGLRTKDFHFPWPEEGFRQMVSRITTLHLAQTKRSKQNLLAEGIEESAIRVVGNTGYDIQKAIHVGKTDPQLPFDIETLSNFALITIHRRENLGAPLEHLCGQIKELMRRYPEMTFIWPKHPNPGVVTVIEHHLADDDPRLIICEPLDYMAFQKLLRSSSLVISDSGGVQEEAASLGVPIAIARNETERPDIVELELGRLVGRDGHALIEVAADLMNRPHGTMITSRDRWIEMQGNGCASVNTVNAVLETFRKQD